MRRIAASSWGFFTLLSLTVSACGGGGGGGNGGPPPSRPDMFYVRESGNDSNDGRLPTAAFRTIQKAVDLVSDGDTIVVGPGTYTGMVEFRRKGGLPNSQIFLTADPTGILTGDLAGPVLIEGTDADLFGIRLSESTHVVLDGFTISGFRSGGNAVAIQIRSGSHFSTTRNCEIVGNREGVRVQDSDDLLLFNNLIVDSVARGVFVGATTPSAAPAGPGSQRARLINNTVANNGGNGIVIGDEDVASKDAEVRNNIIQGNQARNISVAGGAPSSVDGYAGDFNVVFAPDGSCTAEAPPRNCGYGTSAPRGTNDVNADAAFANGEGGDYQLDGGSPAIDTGDSDIDESLLALLQERSTTGANVDEGDVDIGYHFLSR